MKPRLRWMPPVVYLLALLSLVPRPLISAYLFDLPVLSLAISVAFILAHLLGLIYLYFTGRLRHTLLNWAFIILIPFYLLALYLDKQPNPERIIYIPSVMVLTLLLYIVWTVRKTPKGVLDYLKLLYLILDTLRSIVFEAGLSLQFRFQTLIRLSFPVLTALLLVMVFMNSRMLRREAIARSGEPDGLHT